MKHVICPVCGAVCIRYGKNKSGTQRWYCKECSGIFTPKIDNSSKQLQIFLKWLFSKQTQQEMPGEGRSFRRKTAAFWNIWPMPPKIEGSRDVVFVDGIYMGRKACVLICCDERNVLGWYLCRYEHSEAWEALMSRIAEPKVVISDGGSGFTKALKKKWPHANHQRCIFHAFSQVKRYTTSNPKTAAGIELYELSKGLLHLKTKEQAEEWTGMFFNWMTKYEGFLNQLTRDENGNYRPTHERLIKARASLVKLIKHGTMFTYLNEDLKEKTGNIPATNNRIEGGVNAQLRTMLRNHRGLSIERRIKAVFWWCYMHSPKPLSANEILNVMPTDQSIAEIYKKLDTRERLVKSLSGWGDAIVWEEFHRSTKYPVYWD